MHVDPIRGAARDLAGGSMPRPFKERGFFMTFSLDSRGEPFVAEVEAAKFLNVSVRTLQRWRTEPPAGGGPQFFKLGPKRVVYRLSGLSRWAESRAFNSTSEIPGEANFIQPQTAKSTARQIRAGDHDRQISKRPLKRDRFDGHANQRKVD